jgi:hypothetical protein
MLPGGSKFRNVSCQVRLRENLSRGPHVQGEMRAQVMVVGEKGVGPGRVRGANLCPRELARQTWHCYNAPILAM